MKLTIKKELFATTDYNDIRVCALATTVKEAFPDSIVLAGVFNVNIDGLHYEVNYLNKEAWCGVLSMYSSKEEDRIDLEIELIKR